MSGKCEKRTTIRMPLSLAMWIKEKASKNNRSENYVMVKLMETAKRAEEGNLI